MSDYITGQTSSYQPHYAGRFWRLFWLAFGQVLLTIATLGVGRFWMVTRLRRYYWSSVEVDGEPLEYTGRPLEKFIGFLFAVVILAVYLATVNLALAFIGLSYFEGDALALNISVLALVPLGFWAQYRARRYILARTRWRGIRFGASPGAWGYMIRAVGWSLVTLMSFGLLYPLMQMDLARFTTERTWFGDLRFRQEGGVWPLMKSWLWVWLPIAALAVFAAANWADMKALSDSVDTGETFEADPVARTVGLLLLPASAWLIVGYVRHAIFSFRYLNSNRVLGEQTRFSVSLGFWTVVWVYVVGGILMGLVLSMVAAVITVFGAGAMMAAGAGMSLESLGEMNPTAADPAVIAGVATAAAMYLGLILFIMVLTHVFITQPMLRATCRSVRIRGLTYATRARQREHDSQSEAGGFADALGADAGGAF